MQQVTQVDLRNCNSVADQCRALGLVVGDTIEGRGIGPYEHWAEARLTLLWIGETAVVWRETWRSKVATEQPAESAA